MSHPTFQFSLRRDSASQPILASCTIIGEAKGFHPVIRRFGSPEEITNALNRIGIAAGRYANAMKQIRAGSETAFDIDQNEAQNFGILYTDTSE
jgi:hypothetical protein